MATPGKDFVYIRSYFSLHGHLNDIKNRLQKDVLPYIQYIQIVIEKDRAGIGSFSLLRMLMPVVEAVAKSNTLSPQVLLKQLGIENPYLFWSLFRDGFMHNDEFITGSTSFNNVKYEVAPSIGLSSSSTPPKHTYHQTFQMINPMRLYEDLLEYIDRVLSEPDKRIKLIHAINYLETSKDPEVTNIRSEIMRIKSVEM